MSASNYRTQAEDTTYEAERLLIEGYRHMSVAEKVRRVTEDCVALETLVLAGIRARHPAADDDEIRRRLAELRFGRRMAAIVYGSTEQVSDDDSR